jgi:HD-like signal output (HDOD) protein
LNVETSHTARTYLLQALSMRQSIAPMPQVCVQLAELTAQQETDAARLVRLVESDAAVVGEIMRVANSAALRPRAGVASLQHAVSWLGVAEVRNIALAAAVRGGVFTAPGHEPETEELWREACLGSLWAKEVARLRRRNAEAAFLAGLMHRAGAALALKILARFEREQRTALDGKTFADLVGDHELACGRLLMSHWCLPTDIQEAASEWRAYKTCRQTELAGTVRAAHLLAQYTLHPQLMPAESVLDDEVFAQLGVNDGYRSALIAQRDRVWQVAGI